ncbi:MAG TPA: ACP S-malonyltransferase [Burkholderiales bacterium]|nr:ACP S-malonyltransferase [Burkholderiales bacterium]
MKLAIVFPGQGSQAVGMLNGYGDLKAVRDVLAEASDALHQDMAKLLAEGPAAELNLTVNTQPVMLTAGYAAYRAWKELRGQTPAMVAGHSLGEYTALVVAGVLSFADALPLVRLRAQAMQDAVPKGQGGMAALLGLDDDGVRAACAEAAQGEVVEAVNFNAPGQVVIAGHAKAVERAIAAAKARGAKRAVALPVSAPFHSSLMAPAALRLAEALKRVKMNAPAIPVIHNVDAAKHAAPADIAAVLVRQADHPVLWTECVKAMAADGATHVYEAGPGKVLGPLSKRIAPGVEGLAMADRAGLDAGLAVFGGASA